ncbi:Macrolide export ATP-binding/permease protein MacB [Geobacteraceae bacterium]|nr:Macrolide export ATP-binding/permease protein MacB [Geobacteraceae bacterium]
MTIGKLVFRNITRRRGRLVFTLLGITIGIASFVTFLALGGSLKDEIRREASALGANLVVTPKGSCAYEQVSVLTGDQLPATITMEEVGRIKAIGGLTAVPVVTEKTAIRNRPVPVAGVPAADMKSFKGWEVGSGAYFADDERAIVAGATAAELFKLAPGSVVTVRGQQLPVKGILKETGSKDDSTLFIPLSLAQELFKTGEKVSFVAVRVADVSRTDEYVEKIKGAANAGVVTDRQMLKSVLGIVGTVNVTLQLIAAVAVLAAAFGIVNTMLTAAYERRREIGIMQAIGARQRDIFAVFLLESGCYGFMGGILGVIGGLLVSTFAAPLVSQNAFTSFVKGSGSLTLDPKLILGSILFSVAVALAAGLYPAWRAARLTPVEAINHE